MSSLSKTQKREVRRLSGIAYEKELSMAAGELQSQFERWRRGEFDVFVLNEHVHKFHDGISRELYKRYAMGDADWSLASAIGRDILKESEVDPAIVAILRNVIDMARRAGIDDERT